MRSTLDFIFQDWAVQSASRESLPWPGIPFAEMGAWSKAGTRITRQYILYKSYSMDLFFADGMGSFELRSHKSCILYSITLSGHAQAGSLRSGQVDLLAGTHLLHYLPRGTYQVELTAARLSTLLVIPPGPALKEMAAQSPAIQRLLHAMNQRSSAVNSSAIFPYPPRAIRIIRKMESIPANDSGGNLVMQSSILSLLSLLIRQQANLENSVNEGVSSTDKALRIRDYLMSNLGNENMETVSQLANRYFITQRTLTREFIKLTGLPVSLFIRNERLEWARRLILQENLGTEEVALKVGYADGSSFSRAFKKKYGYPPQRYH